MVKKTITLGLILFAHNHSSPVNWALDDLKFAKEAILENHTGAYNDLSPEFCSNLDLFFSTAQEKLSNAQDDNTCKQILHDFGKSFNDAHLRITFPQQTPAISTDTREPIKKRAPFSCDVADDVCYVRIPTFFPNPEEAEHIKSIINAMETMRNSPYIVFDVRGNGGGSSMWGKQITDALFGAGYTHHKRAHALAQQYVEWRASESNIQYLCTDVRDIIHTDFGKESKVAEWLEHIISGMQKAHNTGDMLYRDCSNTFNDVTDIAIHDSLCTSTIVVIMDSHCVSACLDFIDELKLMGTKVILAGEKTMADSLYMECRSIALPSNKGSLVIPIKVYRNRPRGHNVPYTPDIECTDNINNSMKLKAMMILKLQNQP